MQIESTSIPDIKLLFPRRFEDARGFFSETHNQRRFAAAGIAVDFVQDNVAVSRPRGVVRGLHLQIPPFEQAKLVSVLRGSILDVAVDVRKGSPTFGRHVAIELSESRWNAVFIPAGFAHGYCTLEPDTMVFYKVSRYYSPEHERGVLWNDPDLGIAWPVSARDAIVSEKDARNPCLAELPACF